VLRNCVRLIVLVFAAAASTSAPVLASSTVPADTVDRPSVMQADDLAHRNMPLQLAPASTTSAPRALSLSAPSGGSTVATALAAPASGYNGAGMQREMLGFATYWELASGDLSDVQYDKVSTFAYFGLTLNMNGGFDNDSGMTGWNSAALSNLISRAHSAGDRVEVVAKSFSDAAIYPVVSNPSTTGQTAITNIITAARSKGLDGVNIDFEGSSDSNYPNIQTDFTNWIASLSRQLKAAIPGAILTVDSYSGSASWSGGFMRIDTLAPYVDDFFIMAYDMSSPHDLPNAPLAGNYTYTDTTSVQQYLSKVGGNGSKVILGVPYYGYKFSTTSNAWNAPQNTSAINGCNWNCADVYSDIQWELNSCGASQLSVHWDSASATPWAAWWSPGSNDPCNGNHNSWRELYYDDQNSISQKYDLVNSSNIRGAGVWALGYDHGYKELWQVVASKFSTYPLPPAGRYHPLAPRRILDTRGQYRIGPYATMGPNQTLTLNVAGTSLSGIPSGAGTAVLNVTVTNTTDTGHLTVYPYRGIAGPTSTLNFVPGDTLANLDTVALGSGGAINIFNSGGYTDVIVDVEGWYDTTTTGGDGRFHAVSPARIVDTRGGYGLGYSGQTLHAGQTLDIQVAGSLVAGRTPSGIPAQGAAGVVMNLTATDVTAWTWLTVYPTGTTRPTASNLNLPAGGTRANRVAVPLGSGGKVSIYNANGSTDIVVDANGWYSDSTGVPVGGVYTSLEPTRIVDTRAGSQIGTLTRLNPNQTVSAQVAGTAGIPPMSSSIPPTAVILNVTAVGPSAGGWFTVFAAGTSPPMASDLNWAAGQTVPNLVVVRLGSSGGISVTNSSPGSVDLLVDVQGWFS